MERSENITTGSIKLSSIHDANNSHSCGYCGNNTGALSWGLRGNILFNLA
jgi:hypothetical protein